MPARGSGSFNSYRIEGETAFIIIPYKNQVLEALVDASEIPRLLELKRRWRVSYNKKADSFYALCKHHSKSISLHRFVTDAPKGMVVDHRHHQTLDNRRENLRICTYGQNLQNRKGLESTNTSGYRNVTWSKANRNWRVTIKVRGKSLHIGQYDSLEEAAEVALEARRRYMTHATN